MSATDLLYYRLSRRGIEIVSEVICQRHYEEQSQADRGMAPLTEREQRHGIVQTVTPYTGDRPCATCEEYTERVARHANN